MELGNAVFGNSRGSVEVDRGLRDIFCVLYDHMDRYDTIDNEVFWHMPYWWGDCECGFEELDWQWSEENAHAADCYYSEYQALKRDPEKPWTVLDTDAKNLCKKHGISWNDGFGSAVHCTCGRDEAYAKWRETHDHTPWCPIVLDNFIYKPTDLHIQWYKYPFRDSYANREISRTEMLKIVAECIRWLNRFKTTKEDQ